MEFWNIKYADDGHARGDIVNDVVSIGGVSFPTQAVQLAQDVSSDFTDDADSDGILGLGFDSGNTALPFHVKTWFTNVKTSLKKQIFTSRLRSEQGTRRPRVTVFGCDMIR